MKTFFDTSVLFAASSEWHEHHEPSFHHLADADPKTACCAAHSLAELYSTLTRMPGKHRLSAEQALLFLDSLRERVETISLDSQEYRSVIEDAAAAKVIGGAIYDALLVQCARKAGASRILTWNLAHFRRIGRDIAPRIQTP